MKRKSKDDSDSSDDDFSDSGSEYGEETDGPKHRKLTRKDVRNEKDLSLRTPTLDSIAKVCKEKLKELESLVQLKPEKSGKTYKKGKVMTRVERKRKRLIKGHIRRLKKRLRKKRRFDELRAIEEEEKRIVKLIPRTIENTREEDETTLKKDEPDEEVQQEEATDAYSSYYNKQYQPQILVTTSNNPHTRTRLFMRDLCCIIPNSHPKDRNRASIKKTIKQATEKGYTDLLFINEDRRRPNGLLVIHLPAGPTALFRVSNVVPCKEICKNYVKKQSLFRPEVILSNLTTQLGRVVGRMFGALFNYDPDFKGRRVCTFHNQRDYIFFRNHRYEFKNGKKVNIKELGPRFTLRLQWLQQGAFEGDFEWILKRHEMETSRRRFFL